MLLKFRCLPLLALSAISLFIASPVASAGDNAVERRSTRVTRLVWQDREKKALCSGDLVLVGSKLTLQQRGPIEGFPAIEIQRQELVQMERLEDVLLVGVRDDDDGHFSSGWVAVDLGVDEVAHGDHSDFDYRNPPCVLASVLDTAQGNPAHLYAYDGAFYLANDHLNGFTRLLPESLRGPVAGRAGVFHRGGGGHITLAAIDGKVCYATWIGGDGPLKGKIDVSNLSKSGEQSVAYSFQLPSGGLHGATANSGKIFFAPSDGVYWVAADLSLQQKPELITFNHLALGTEEQSKRSLRTGAFTNHRNWVLFTTGRQSTSALCLVDANVAAPSVVKLPIPAADGLSLVTPETVLAESGKRYAFIFQNHSAGDVQEVLTIVDLDPNGDQNFADAAVVRTVEVGESRVEGHYGHHSISFDDDFRYGMITNPGNGEIWVLSLESLNVLAKYQVGGVPTKVIAVGGKEHKH